LIYFPPGHPWIVAMVNTSTGGGGTSTLEHVVSFPQEESPPGSNPYRTGLVHCRCYWNFSKLSNETALAGQG
jgi:hypothetical protein